jgi:hypothetical protein
MAILTLHAHTFNLRDHVSRYEYPNGTCQQVSRARLQHTNR